jgi:hypothetical protein
MVDVERGRRKIFRSVVGATSFLVLGAIGSWHHGIAVHPMALVISPAIFATLGILMYRGAHWAREVVVIWLGLSALLYAGGGVSTLPRYPLFGITALFFAIAFGYDAFVLYTSEDVEAVVNPGAVPTRTSR